MHLVMSSISLRISGNKLANEGFRVLVSIGTPSPDVKDMAIVPGLIENEYYFFIRHEADQIIYSVQKTRIRSYGAARDGRLMMAIGIPKGFEVESASPYDVLMDIYNTFISRYTTDSLGGTQFSNADVEASVFQEILDRYRLVPARNRYLPMNPDRAAKAFVLLPSSRQIADLMRDSQYAEFQQFGEILVAQEGSTTYPRLTVSVPRPLHYKVYVNNVLSNTEITSLTETYTATADMGECFDCTPVRFSLAELKAGTVPPEVKIDLQKEAVYCTLSPRPKVQVWKLVLDGEHPGYGQVKVRDKRSGAEIPVDANGQFQLSGNQIVSTLEVVSGDPSFIKNGLDNKDNVNKVLRGSFMKRKPTAPGSKPAADSGVQNVSFKVLPSSFKDRRIDLHLEGGGKELVIPQARVFNGEATVSVPVGFFPKVIRVSAESEHYSTFDRVARLEPEKEHDVVLQFSKKDFLSFSWGRMLLAGLAGLIVGGLIGWLCFGGVLKKDGNASGSNGVSVSPGSGSEEPVVNVEEALKDVRLEMTFAEVEELIKKAPDGRRAKAYREVLDMIYDKKPFGDKRYERNGEIGQLLSLAVRTALQATYLGGYDFTNNVPQNYNSEAKRQKAQEEYQKGEFKSFKELFHIYEIVESQK